MALAEHALPFGLRDVKLRSIGANGALGTSTDLPASRTFSFTEAEEFTDLRGDDILQASRGQGPQINWSLEAGGISLDAYTVMAGGTVTESGMTPAIKRTLSKHGYATRPYFLAEGLAISDSGGDTHIVLYRCRATGDLAGELGDGAFYMTSASGVAYPDPNNLDEDGNPKLYDIVLNETETAIVTI
jgi:hypothetical protein